MAGKRKINMKVLAGEPLDGSGRVCIHLFVQDKRGSFVEPNAIMPVFRDGVQVKQEVTTGDARGRLACDAKRNPRPTTHNRYTIVTSRTDDPRAVTCPKCLASKECKDIIDKIAQFEAAR